VALPWARPVSALIPADGGVVRKVIAAVSGPGLAGGDAVIRRGERELRLQAGPGPGPGSHDPRPRRGHRLVPVMFEPGARPHPPRQVYRCYLAQSQVFVGVYWQS
jgi:hypothetical protein